jgi:methylated-DNA-[protein]-cysteine S-methyltransferase
MEEVRVAIPSISRTNDHGAPLRAKSLIVSCRQSLVALTYASGSGIFVSGGVREVGWGLQPRGASIKPDEVQMALGQLREYFAGQCREFTLPLDLHPMEPVGEAVLQALRTVGYGKMITLGELAALSETGVLGAGDREDHGGYPVPIIMPCHGIVASDGLGGYSGGDPARHLETKCWLLENK